MAWWLAKTHSISSGPHITPMWWPDDLVNLLILLFDFITKPYWLDTWYLHPIMLCDPTLNYVTSFGPAVSYWFYFILVYLVVNVWPVTASVDCFSRPETAHVAYLILFFSKFCVQFHRFHLWCLPQVIPYFILFILIFIFQTMCHVTPDLIDVPHSNGTIDMGLVLYINNLF